jgi:hypothetical protein
MKALTALPLLAIGGALFLLSGCGDDNAMMSQGAPLVARTVPTDGEPAYDSAASIHITFSTPMDTARFHERFFCLGVDVHDGVHDSLTHGLMMDSTMMVCDSIAHGIGGDGMSGMSGMMGMRGGRHGDMQRNVFGFDMMDDARHMPDTAAFYRRMHDRRIPGRFQWNDQRDSCVFMPHSALVGNRDYAIMMRSMGEQMGGWHDAGMMGNGPDDYMIRFHTR